MSSIVQASTASKITLAQCCGRGTSQALAVGPSAWSGLWKQCFAQSLVKGPREWD